VATVTGDGVAVVSLPLADPQPAAGQVQLGAINDVSSGDSTAAFADAELRLTLPVTGKPVLWSFDDPTG
jgi:hypothetical protein